MNAWDSLFSQIGPRKFTNAAFEALVDTRMSQVTPTLEQIRQKKVVTLAEASLADQALYKEIDALYDIPYVLKRIRRSKISARMLERVCVGGRTHSYGLFYRRVAVDTDGKRTARYVPCESDAGGAKRYDLHNDYMYRMRRHMKENFDAFSRGHEHDTPHGQFALCKVCVYGWAVYSGVLDYIESSPPETFKSQKRPRDEGVVRYPMPLLKACANVKHVVGVRPKRRRLAKSVKKKSSRCPAVSLKCAS